ncbi:unnamed protein product [Rotaria magnacalcarata]|uniref:Tetratricopeptide repeat protein n=3 Tax=Rotaria magnacalcarata TaxID=392030 RepID=A0A815MIZ4_9BILA|nr:unnamed protein product [Rotaria magnacalcarata]
MGHKNSKSYSLSAKTRLNLPLSLISFKINESLPRNHPQSMTEIPSGIHTYKLPLTPIESTKIIENYVVVWFGRNIDEDRNSINQIRRAAHSFQLFTDIDELFAFIVKLKDEKLLLILSDPFAQKIVSSIHQTSQLNAIYILSNDRLQDELWIKQFGKIKGTFTHMESICKKLKDKLFLSEEDIIPIEVLDATTIIIQYLIKKILLDEIVYHKKSRKRLIKYARQQHANELDTIKEFEENYIPSKVIWWYTRKCFLYVAMNKAFHTHDIEFIIKMGFFIRDLHRQINQSDYEIDNQNESIVYRGQGISEHELEMLKNNKNGLLSFNNFLWTNTNRDTSLQFAYSARNNPDLIGVLFQMKINSSIKSISLEKLSYDLNSESGILFSIYTVFRIDEIKQVDEKIWLIDLILTNDSDQQLQDYFRSVERIENKTAWQQLGFYFIQINEFDKAELLYRILLQSNATDDSEQLAVLNERLGFLYNKKNNLIDSLLHYKKSLEIYLTISLSDDSSLYSIYLNIGNIFHKQNNLNEAMENYKCALNIILHSLKIDLIKVATVYYHIAEIYNAQGLFIEAIQNYQSSLENELKIAPHRHLTLANTYNRIGAVFYQMKDFITAFSYYEKTLKIQKKYLSLNHSTLAETNYHIAMTFAGLQQYRKAIEYAALAVNIAPHSLESNDDHIRLYEDYLHELREKTLIGVLPNGPVDV